MTYPTKFLLGEADIPRQWYNVMADLPFELAPLLHPETKTIADNEFLGKIFSQRFIDEMSSRERWIDIPQEVLDIYRIWRPSPLVRAKRLEKALDTPAQLYYKFEGVSPTGSHKLNTAVPQVFYAKEEGILGMTTETGAGQWGSALSLACRWFDMDCHVFMVRCSYEQKPFRKFLMQNFGARVDPSPSQLTEYGRNILAGNPEHSGTLGIAVTEAVEKAMNSNGQWQFAFGSVFNPVLLHQSIIGLETVKQLEMAGVAPDIVIACVGAGSNWGGFVLPLIAERLRGGSGPRAIAAEPSACPSLTQGVFRYEYADSAGLSPLSEMYTLGKDFVPSPIHAGGLRYHAVAPIVSALVQKGIAEAVAVSQAATLEAGLQFARSEGITPAPESAHAIRVAIDEALLAKRDGVAPTIVFNVSGHGLFDLAAYDAYLNGSLG